MLLETRKPTKLQNLMGDLEVLIQLHENVYVLPTKRTSPQTTVGLVTTNPAFAELLLYLAMSYKFSEAVEVGSSRYPRRVPPVPG